MPSQSRIAHKIIPAHSKARDGENCKLVSPRNEEMPGAKWRAQSQEIPQAWRCSR
jgi:hypothetical protein